MGAMVKIAFDMELGQERIRVSGSVPEAPVPARRMLPFFQQIADQVVGAAVREVEREGKTVSCKAGCGACCRQLVPITRTDARELHALVGALPEPRRTQVRERFAKALESLGEAGLREPVSRMQSLPPAERQALALRYLAQRVACPFLEDESCSIHARRPIICREYLVTSPAEHCVAGLPEHLREVPLETQLSAGTAWLESDEGRGTLMPLVMALEWAEAHAGDEPERRPPVEWINTVFGVLAAAAELQP
jgi:Fe-S-cluster containining protein